MIPDGIFFKILPTVYAEVCALCEHDLKAAALAELGRESLDADPETLRARLAANRAWRAARAIGREVERLSTEVAA